MAISTLRSTLSLLFFGSSSCYTFYDHRPPPHAPHVLCHVHLCLFAFDSDSPFIVRRTGHYLQSNRTNAFFCSQPDILADQNICARSACSISYECQDSVPIASPRLANSVASHNMHKQWLLKLRFVPKACPKPRTVIDHFQALVNYLTILSTVLVIASISYVWDPH